MMQCQILQKNRINFCELIPMGKNVNKSVVNVKIDNDVKSKLETLAFIRKQTIQELCESIFIKEIEALKAENSQLKAQIAELTSKTATKKAEKPVEVVAETAEVEEAPKETKKSTAKKSTNK